MFYCRKYLQNFLSIWIGHLWLVSVVARLSQLHVSLSVPVTSYRSFYGWTSVASDKPGHSKWPEHKQKCFMNYLLRAGWWWLQIYIHWTQIHLTYIALQCIYHFADGASFLGSFLSTGDAEVCIHKTHLPRDGLGEHWQSCGVISL